MNDLVLENANNTNENYCLIFSLDGKPYGINVSNVLEIIKVPKINVPQKMPKHVLGVISYNNISMRVVDLCGLLLKKPHSYGIESQIIIVKTEESFFGIITDNVVDVRLIRPSHIRPLPYQSENNLIQCLYKFKEMFISIVDLNSVQNVLQQSQLSPNEYDVSEQLVFNDTELKELERRQYNLIKKFDANIDKAYFDQEQYIVFELNENLYSLPIKQIKEIVKYKNVSVVKLPAKYDYIDGIFNLRGDFISVVNFKKFLNISNSNTFADGSMLIVLDIKEFKIALLVDKIIEIITVMSSQLVNKVDNRFEANYVISELHVDDKIVSVINLDKLLADERLYIKD